MNTSKDNRLTHYRSRTPSPELFNNNLSDFENTDDDEGKGDTGIDGENKKVHEVPKFQTEIEIPNIHSSIDSDTCIGNVKDGAQVRVHSKSITKPNFMSRQPKKEIENPVSSATITKLSTGGASTRVECQSDTITDGYTNNNKTEQKSGDKQEIPNKRDVEFKQTLPTDENALPPKELTNEFNHGDWVGSWSLNEDDLVEKGHYADPTIRIDPSLTESAREPASMHKKIRWPKFQKFPRAYHYRPSRNPISDQYSKMSKLMSKSSPFAILSTIASQLNIKLKDVIEKYDETTFNEQFPVRFPCMQCYEKQGTKAYGYDSYYGGGYDSYYDDYGSYETTDLDKCKKCGGKIQTMGTFIKMITGLRDKFESNNLVVHDVYPDGNCLFAAVVDQLRIRGVFEYTNQNLRQASVDYLRENPISSDGETHFELFLSDETWEDYLTRMSQDGEWGDHMVLSAIANITHQRIVIFGGRSGSGQTIILPTDLQEPLPQTDTREQPKDSFSDQDENKEDETAFEEDGNTDVSTETNFEAINTAKLHAVKDIMRQKDDAIKLSQGQEDGKKEGKQKETETENAEERVNDEYKPPDTEEEDWRDFDKTGTIMLGHFGESHYVSLRPNDWQDNLFSPAQIEEPIIAKRDEDGYTTQDHPSTTESKIPVDHLNFFLKYFFTFKYLQSKYSDRIDFVHMKSETEFAKEEGVGAVFNRLRPCFDRVKIVGPDIGIFLPVESENEDFTIQSQGVTDDEIRTLLFIPKDTAIRYDMEGAQKFDLLAEKVPCYPELTRLRPIRVDKWKGAMLLIDGTDYLEAIEPKEQMLLAFQIEWRDEGKAWLKRHRPAKWPDSKTLKKVSEEGFHVVPVVFAKEFNDFDEELVTLTAEQLADQSLWAFCYAIPERAICNALTTAQLNTFYLFQRLLEFLFRDRCIPLIAYRHIFYYACENISRSDWESKPGLCLMILMKKMSSSLRDGILPHYFNPKINIFRSTSRRILEICTQKIDLLHNMLFVFIHFLLDKHQITNSETGFLFEEVIEDVFNYQIHRDIQRSFRHSLVAASLSLVSSFVYQGEYEFGLNTVLVTKEELKGVGIRDVSNQELLTKCLPEHIGYRWCFALFYDIKQGTKITQRLLDGLPSVPICEVFGPEVLPLLPATVVPKQFVISGGSDLHFPVEVVKVLKEAKCTKAIATGLRYYLDTYFDHLYSVSSQVKFDHTYSNFLHNLLVSLYNSYDELGRREEFRDLLPRFIEISQNLQGKGPLQNVKAICSALGEEDRIKQYKGKGSNMFQFLFGY